MKWLTHGDYRHLVHNLGTALCGKYAPGWTDHPAQPCPDCLASLHALLDEAFDGT